MTTTGRATIGAVACVVLLLLWNDRNASLQPVRTPATAPAAAAMLSAPAAGKVRYAPSARPSGAPVAGGSSVFTTESVRAEWRCESGRPVLYVVGRIAVTNAGTATARGLTVVPTVERRGAAGDPWTAEPAEVFAPAPIAPGETVEHEWRIPVRAWEEGAEYRARLSVSLGSATLEDGRTPEAPATALEIEPPVDLCAVTCTLGPEFWSSRAAGGTEAAAGWPVASLTLGTRSYDAGEAFALLERSSRSRTPLNELTRQLIAVKLNVAAGADPADAAAAIRAADALIGARRLPFRRGEGAAPGSVGPVVERLERYNRGLIGPGSCGSVAPAAGEAGT